MSCHSACVNKTACDLAIHRGGRWLSAVLHIHSCRTRLHLMWPACRTWMPRRRRRGNARRAWRPRSQSLRRSRWRARTCPCSSTGSSCCRPSRSTRSSLSSGRPAQARPPRQARSQGLLPSALIPGMPGLNQEVHNAQQWCMTLEQAELSPMDGAWDPVPCFAGLLDLALSSNLV